MDDIITEDVPSARQNTLALSFVAKLQGVRRGVFFENLSVLNGLRPALLRVETPVSPTPFPILVYPKAKLVGYCVNKKSICYNTLYEIHTNRFWFKKNWFGVF